MKKNEGEKEIQPNNPLHGVRLKDMLAHMEEHYGWEMMAARVKINCFQFDPSFGSCLKFLRRTPWAKAQVEELYLELLHDGIIPPQKVKKTPSH